MLINPKTAIDNQWITFPKWMTAEQQTKCIQPNGLDITADALHQYGDENDNSDNIFVLSEINKKMRAVTPVIPDVRPVTGDLAHWLIPAKAYVDVTSDFRINVPPGAAAMFIVRSTLCRNGLFITSGLFDSGFSGNCGFILHNNGNDAYLAPHTRIGQILFLKSEDSGLLYTGTYNQFPTQHWSTLPISSTPNIQ